MRNKVGCLGEIWAANFMRKNGYEIIAANYRTRFGEIDIIAKDKKYLVFVEVKTRNPRSIAAPREFVDISKQKKICKTALMYINQNSKIKLQPRFDVIEVFVEDDFVEDEIKDQKNIKINHIVNAFNMCDTGEVY